MHSPPLYTDPGTQGRGKPHRGQCSEGEKGRRGAPPLPPQFPQLDGTRPRPQPQPRGQDPRRSDLPHHQIALRQPGQPGPQGQIVEGWHRDCTLKEYISKLVKL